MNVCEAQTDAPRSLNGRKCKILIVSSALGRGGGEVYALRNALALRAIGHDVALACRRKSWLSAAGAAEGIPLLPVAPRNSGDIFASTRIAAALVLGSYDVLHAHVGRDYLPAVVAGKVSGRPVVLTRHTVFPMHPISARAASGSARVIAVSGAVRDSLVQLCGIPDDRICVVRTGVDLSRFNPLEPKPAKRLFDVDADTVVFGVMNELHQGKRCHILLRAAAAVARNYPNVRFILVGDGPAAEELKQLSIDLGLDSKVVFTGYRADVHAVLPEMDVLVSASNTEGFNMALVEGMACGLAIIATDLPAHSELVAEAETGWLFPIDDHEALAEKMKLFAHDRDLGRRMGQLGRLRTEHEFSQERMLQEIESIYDSVCRN